MATNLHQVKRGYADLKRSGTQMYYERMGHGDPVILIHQCWWNNFEFEGVIPMLFDIPDACRISFRCQRQLYIGLYYDNCIQCYRNCRKPAEYSSPKTVNRI